MKITQFFSCETNKHIYMENKVSQMQEEKLKSMKLKIVK